ncbi:hypothetical protein [Corynebacterium pelargi]|uniref:Uncharacterized protein n=1 Tax=Corynebacterium pelargi TaxID=1471400 RepID=A0A410WAE4_9CORY|nr:hypothetical protein [Corynebacterium pelargi]QAU52922.1 hypothetical protein CPELA_08335 [Corynebacterium pelargi]GGG76027.1 hypothetical protein GCM10007338_12120 [Corynebacterium pelargi]
MLVAIPGRNLLKKLPPAPLKPHEAISHPVPAIDPALRQQASSMLQHALEVAAGMRAVASLKQRHFAEQVRRHITARLVGGQRIDSSVKLESLHLRIQGQRIDAVGSATSQQRCFGYLAQFEPAMGNTPGLRMRSLRVL